jgi:hypothetical protein
METLHARSPHSLMRGQAERLRRQLGGWRGFIVFGIVALPLGVAFNWSWLIHRTTMDNGVASMAKATALEVPPQGSLMLKPGGTHIMLVGTRADLKVGDLLPLRLTFQRAGTIDVAAQIFPLGAADPFAEK